MFMKNQSVLNYHNAFWSEKLDRVAVSNVQQVSDRAFYQKGGRWIDSRLVENEKNVRPSRVIEFGSDEFRALAQRLAGEGRSGCVALRGDVLLMVDDQPVLVKTPVGP